MEPIQFVLWAVLTLGVLSGPLSTENLCSHHCRDDSKFGYEKGQSYVYDYAVDTVTSMTEDGSDESRLHLTAIAELSKVTSCDFKLQLRGVHLLDSSSLDDGGKEPVAHEKEFKAALEMAPLYFSFVDGHIGDICTPTDTPWVLNIKRGLLSTLQHTIERIESNGDVLETDINGNCKTTYVTEKGWNSVKVSKSKDLLSCTKRQHKISPLQSTQYTSHSDIQSLPLLKSLMECEQSIQDQIINQATCNERHEFKPFSNNTIRALARSKQSLIFKEKKPHNLGQRDEQERFRTSLIFDHMANNDGNLRKGSETVKDILRELESQTKDQVTKETPRMFSSLIIGMKELTFGEMKTLYNRGSKTIKKFFSDALPMVGTPASIEMINYLYAQGMVSDSEMSFWFTTIGFTSSPTRELITALEPFLKHKPQRQALLGISALINQYCTRVDDCHHDTLITDIVRNIAKFLGSSCYTRTDDEKNFMMVVLKAIGNIGVPADITDTLQKCYKESNSIEVRIAAMDSFRRMPCGFGKRDHLIQFFLDHSQDSELRIAAYLSMMKCPDIDIITSIRNALTREPVNQVGSFVWTHLTNLQETSDPTKGSIKELVGSTFLKNKFNTDARKFSRNFEGSLFWDKYNVGTQAESNIIFSTKSYLPRSAMFNFTIHLFGEAVNLFEIGGRAEGFESMVENLFGKNGYFPEQNVKNMLEEFRGKESKSSLGELMNIFKQTTDSSDDLHASAYIKMFGSDIAYATLNDAKQMKMGYFMEELTKFFSKKSIDFTKSSKFLDMEYSLPMATGFPLRMHVNGTATMKLKAQGKMNTEDLFNSYDLDISGHFIPSAAIEMSMQMKVDANVAYTGIELSTRMSSRTAFDGSMTLKNGKIFSAFLSAPEDKVEIFDFSSNLLVHRRGERSVYNKAEPMDNHEICSGWFLDKILGLKLCGQVERSKPKHDKLLMSGPTNVKLYLDKTDSFSEYQVQFNFENEEEKKLELHLDTPGSKTSRKIQTKILVKPEGSGHSASAKLVTPFMKTWDISGNYEYNENTKSITVLVKKETTELLQVRSFLRSERTDNIVRIEPYLHISSLNVDYVKIQGNMAVAKQRKYSTDLVISHLTEKPIKLTGHLDMISNKMDFDINVDSSYIVTAISGSMNTQTKAPKLTLRMTYQIEGSGQETINFYGKFSNTSTGRLRSFGAFWELTNSAYPNLNIQISWDTQFDIGKYFENKISILQSESQTVWTSEQLISLKSNPTDYSVIISMACPQRDIDYRFELSHKWNSEEMIANVIGRLSSSREVSAKCGYTRDSNKMSYNGLAEIRYPGKVMKAVGHLKEATPNNYESQMTIDLATGDNIVIEGRYANEDDSLTLNQNGEIRIKVPNMPKVTLEGSVYGGHGETKVISKGSMNSQTYGVEVHYKHSDERELRIQSQTPSNTYSLKTIYSFDASQARGQLDIQTDRHFSIQGSLNRLRNGASAEIEGYLDKSRHPGERYGLKSKLTPDVIDIKAEMPHGVYILEVNRNSEETSVLARTPSGEEIRVKIDHALEYENTKLGVTATTPFRRFRSQKMEVHYQLSENNIKGQITGEWNGSKQVKISMTGTHDLFSVNPYLKAQGMIQSTEIQDAAEFGFEYQTVEDETKIYIDTTLKQQKYFLSGKLLQKPRNIDVRGELEFKLPFGKSNTGSISVNLLKKRQELKTGISASIGSERAAIQFEGESKRGPEVNLNLKVENSLGRFNDLEIILTGIKKKDATFQAKAHLMFNKEHTLTLKTQGKYLITRSLKDIQTIGQFTSSFTEDYTLQGEIKIDNSKKVIKMTATGKDQKASLDLAIEKLSSDEIDGQVEVSFLNHILSGTISHKMGDSTINTILRGKVNKEDFSVTIKGNREKKSSKNSQTSLTMEIVFPLINVDAGRVSFSQLIDSKNVYHTIEVEQNNAKIALKQQLKEIQDSIWEHLVSLETPYSEMSRIYLKNRHDRDDKIFGHDFEGGWNEKKVIGAVNYDRSHRNSKTQTSAGLSLKSPFTKDIQFSLNHEMQIDELNPMHISFSHGDQMIELIAKAKLGQTDGQVSVEANISQKSPLKMEIKYDLSKVEKRAALTINHGTEKVFGLRANGALNAAMSSITFDVTMPSSLKLNGDFAYDIQNPQKTVTLTGNYNGKIIRMSGTYESSRKHELSFDIQTPFHGMNSLKGQVGFSTLPGSLDILLSKDSSTFSTSLQWEIESATGTINGKVRTPFSGFEESSLSMKYLGRYGFHEVSTSLDLAGEEYRVKGSISTGKTQGDLHLSIKTPFASLKEYNGEGKYSFSKYYDLSKYGIPMALPLVGDFKLTSSVVPRRDTTYQTTAHFDFEAKEKVIALSSQKGEKSYTFDLKGELDYDVVTLTLEGMTPFSGMKSFATTAKYDLRNPTKIAEVKTTLNGKEKAYSGSIKYEPSSIEAIMTTPHKEFEKLHFLSFFENNGFDKKFNLLSGINDRNVEMSFECQKTDKYTGKLNVKTPFSGSHFAMNGDLSSNYVSVSAEHGAQKITVNMNYEYLNHDGEAALTIMTPFTHYEKLQLRTSFSTHPTKKSITVNANAPRNVMSLTGQLESQSDKYVLTSALNVDGELDSSLRIAVQKNADQYSSEIHTKFNQSEYRLVSSLRFSDEKELVATLQTPSQAYDFNFHGKMKVQKKQADLSGKLNTKVFGFETMEFESSLRNETPKKKSASIMMKTNDKQLKASGSIDIERHGESAKISIQLPSEYLSDFELKYKRDWSEEGKLVDMEGQYGSNSYKIKTEMNKLADKNYKLQGTVETPIKKWKRLEISCNLDAGRKPQLEITANKDQEFMNMIIKTDTEQSNEIGLTVGFSSSYTQNHKLDSSVKIKMIEDRLELSGNGRLGDEYRIDLTSKMGLKKGQIKVRSNIPNFENIETNWRAAFEPKEIIISGNVLADDKQLYEMKFNSKIKSFTNFMGEAYLSTQKEVKPFDLEWKVNVNDQRRSEIKVRFISPYVKDLVTRIQYTIKKDRANSELLFKFGDRKMELTGDYALFNGQKMFSTNVNFISTLLIRKSFSVSGKYDLTSSKKSIDFHIENDYDKIAMTGKYDLTDGSTDFSITTPFSAIKDLAIITAYRNNVYSGKILYNQLYEFTGSLGTSSENAIIEMKLNTPKFKSIELTLQKISSSNPTIELQLRGLGKKMDMLLSYNSDTTFGGKLDINGNLFSDKDYSITGEYSTRDHKLSMVFDDGRRLELTGEVRVTKSQSKGSLILVTPIRGFESVKLSGLYSISNNQFTGNLAAKWGEETIYFNISGEMKNDSGSGTISISTPFRKFENFGLEVVYEVKDGVYSLKGNSDVNSRHKIQFQSEFSPKHASITLETPFKTVKNINFLGKLKTVSNGIELTSKLQFNKLTMSLDSQYIKSGNKYSVKTTATYNQYAYSIDSNAKIENWGSLDASINIATPFKYYQNMNAQISFSVTPKVSKASLKMVGFNSENWEGKLSYDISRIEDMGLKLSLTTPIDYFSDININVNGGVSSNKGGNFGTSINIENRSHTLVMKYDVSTNSKFRMTINSDYVPFGLLDVSGECELDRNKIIGSIKIENSNEVYETSLVYKLNANKLKISVKDTMISKLFHVRNTQLIIESDLDNYMPIKLQADIEIKIHSRPRTYGIVYRKSQSTSDKMDITVTFSQMKKSHTLFYEHQTSSEKSFTLRINTPWIDGEEVTLQGSIDPTSGKGRATMTVFGDEHSVQGMFKDWTHGTFTISSNLIPRHKATISYNVDLMKTSNKLFDANVEITVFDEMFKFEGLLDKKAGKLEGTFKLSSSIDYLDSNKLNFSVDTGKFLDIHALVQTKIRALENLEVTAKLDTSIQGVVEIVTPIKGYEKLSAQVKIPLHKTQSNPEISVSTPNGDYVFSGNYRCESDRIHVAGNGIWNGDELLKVQGTLLLSSPYELDIALRTPIVGHENYKWNMKAQMLRNHANDIAGEVEINGKKIEIAGIIDTKEEAKNIKFEVKTPFDGHRLYGLYMRFENSQRKTVHAELKMPKTSIGFEADYYFNSLKDFVVKGRVLTPFEDSAIDFQIVNQIHENLYKTVAKAQTPSFDIGTSMTGVLNNSGFELGLHANIYEHVIAAEAVLKNDNEAILADFNLKTPFRYLETAEVVLKGQTGNNGFDSKALISYNAQTIVNMEIYNKDGKRIMEVRNPILPFAISYTYNTMGNTLDLRGELSWDLLGPKPKSLGGMIVIKTKPTGRTVKLMASYFTRVAELSLAYDKTNNRFKNSFYIGLNKKEMGYDFSYFSKSGNTKTVLKLLNPIKPVVLEYSLKSMRGVTISKMLINCETRTMGIIYERESDSSFWSSSKTMQSKISFIYPRQEAPLTIELKKTASKGDVLGGMSLKIAYMEETLISMGYEFTKFLSKSNEEKRLRVSVYSKEMNVDSELNISWMNKDSTYEIKLTGRYMTEDKRQLYLLNEKLVFDLRGKQILVKLIRDDISYTITLGSEMTEYGSKVVIEYFVNENREMMAEMTLRTKAPLASLKLQISPHHIILMDAGLHNNREIGIKIWRNKFGREIRDLNILMKLQKKYAITTDIHWRPEMKQELYEIVNSLAHTTEKSITQDMDSVETIIQQEWQQKIARGKRMLSRISHDYNRQMRKDFSQVQHEYDQLVSILETAFERNSFYCRDVFYFVRETTERTLELFNSSLNNVIEYYNSGVEYFKPMVKRLHSYTGKFIKTLKMSLEKVFNSNSRVMTAIRESMEYLQTSKQSALRMLKYYISNVSYIWNKNFGELDEMLREQLKIIETSITEYTSAWEEAIQSIRIEIDKTIATQKHEITKYIDTIKSKLNTYTEQVRSHPMYKTVSSLYFEYASWLEEFHVSDTIDYLKDNYARYMDDATRQLQKASEKYHVYFVTLTDAIHGHYGKLRQVPLVAYIMDAAGNIHVKALSLVENLVPDKNTHGMISKIINEMKQYLADIAQELSSLVSSQGNKWKFDRQFVFEPENGKILYTQFLPFEWHSFQELPKIDMSQETSIFDRLRSKFDLTGKYYQLVDMFQKSYSFGMKNIIPPFGATAMLAGSQHYMTFDKKYFEFAGDCSYLLAYDYTDRNFTAMVNYEGSNGRVSKKSLSVTTNEHIIEINNNFKVTVNGQTVNLPYTLPKTIIKREGAKVIVSDEHGINIECNLARDLCTMRLSGWYYGKTAGLLGTYNNELHDDFMTPMHEIKSNVESFAYSWKVGTTRCKAKNYATLGSKYNKRAYQECQALFESMSSLLRPCFSVVDPKPYMTMCVNDMENYLNEPEMELGTCVAASAYVTTCKAEGVDVWMPPTCVRCELDDGHVLAAGENKTYTNNAPRHSDVVIIVEQKACSGNYPISEIAMNIDTMLESKGITNNKFALVGFGGKGNFEEPHTHTMHDKIWVSSAGIENMIKSSNVPHGDNAINIYRALRYALNLPFRAGVSKNFILLACGSCDHNQMSSEYADMWHLLAERDVKLHIVSPDVINFKSSKKASKVIGFDMNNAYTINDAKTFQGDSSLRQQINIPKDYCTPLAMETTGSLFSFPEDSAGKKIMNKKMIKVMATRVADSAEPSECQNCECVANKDNVGVSRCTKCVSPGLNKFIQYWEKLSYNIDSEEEESSISFVPRTSRHTASRKI